MSAHDLRENFVGGLTTAEKQERRSRTVGFGPKRFIALHLQFVGSKEREDGMRLKTRIRLIALFGIVMILGLALRCPTGNVIFATFGGAFCWMLRK